MKYKVGDIVKLRDDLEIDENYGGTVFTVLTHKLKHQGIKIIKVGTDYYIVEGENKIIAYASDEMIEGLWEECKPSEQVEKYNEHTLDAWRYAVESKSEVKYKLIDILNKIANGELKEGTKVIRKDVEGWGELEYTYTNGDLERECCDETIYFYEEIFARHLNEEVELIEPQEPTECEHEWVNYGRYNPNTGETKDFRKCAKCDLEEDIEPTDNTKIEELDKEEMLCLTLQCAIAVLTDKLNEVIRYINKEE